MIIKKPFEIGLNGESGIDVRYFGKDAENFLRSIKWDKSIEYLGKECIEDDKRGIIVGFEDSASYMDYYYIVYFPESGETTYALANNAEFTRTIIV